MRLLGWMAAGFLIYYFYGIKHSKVRQMRRDGKI
ncbi:MAG: hypothetical protein NTY32_09480 [Bacteroidia bacterium]|nr:hypothetical protein [Bacteroidia bacterium]